MEPRRSDSSASLPSEDSLQHSTNQALRLFAAGREPTLTTLTTAEERPCIQGFRQRAERAHWEGLSQSRARRLQALK